MTYKRAIQILDAFVAQAELNAPVQEFKVSYALGALVPYAASLIERASKPRMVSMDDRTEEAVEIKLPVVVSGNYQPSERATTYFPGCPEFFSIESIFIGGLELPGEIAAWIERECGEELQEAILERRAVLRHDMEGV